MMKRASTPIHVLQAVALALILAGCGGGGNSAPGSTSPDTQTPPEDPHTPPDPTTFDLTGRIAATSAAPVTVCLDTDRSLGCDENEPATTAGADGAFHLTLPASTTLQGQFLVAEFSEAPRVQALSSALASGAASVFTLVAPAVDHVVIGGLTTLLSVGMLQDPGTSLDDAQSNIKTTLGLAPSTDLLAGPDVPENNTLQPIEDAALNALSSGTAAYAASASGSTGNAVIESAPVVLRTLAKYIDPTTAKLYPFVTARTLTSETAGTLNPPHCSIETPPMISIETDGHSPVVSKDHYLAARVRMQPTAEFPEALDLTAKIRGRGNSTWGMPKKPYKLKLHREAALLGMAADNDWALLANYADKTMLRNAAAMCLGKIMGMDYVPAHRFVELTLNGDYQGVYQLSEHIRVSDQRVNLGSPAIDDTDVDAGFLLELDDRRDDTPRFESSMGIPYTVKSDATPQQVNNIESFINVTEQSLNSPSYADPDTGYAQHVDVESLIDFYLINEFMRNNDAFHSSTYLHRKRAGKLTFGPLWDFDIAAGNINYNGNGETDGWWVRGKSAYVTRLLEDPAFDAQLRARWQYLKTKQPQLQQFIDDSARTLDDAQQRNFQKWNILNTCVWPNPVIAGSYSGEVGYLKYWLDRRSTWMTTKLGPADAPPAGNVPMPPVSVCPATPL